MGRPVGKLNLQTTQHNNVRWCDTNTSCSALHYERVSVYLNCMEDLIQAKVSSISTKHDQTI